VAPARGARGHGGSVRAFGSAVCATPSATETLRDERTVEIRAQCSQNREAMRAAIARSSSGRFTVRREFSQKETDYFLDIDSVNHVALGAAANDAAQPTIVGGGQYVAVQPGQAEVAFVIIDAYDPPLCVAVRSKRPHHQRGTAKVPCMRRG
jgi:hypothetical protein